MKVLFNASMYSDYPSGVAVYTKQVWNNLSGKLEKENIYFDAYTYSTNELINKQKIKPVKLPFNFFFKRFLSLHRLVWNLFYLHLVAKKYDLVYSFSTHGSPFIKNQIITIHDLICFSYPRQHRFQFLYFKYILPYILKSCLKIVVISEFTKQEVVKYFKVAPEKIIVIYNGGDHLLNTEIKPILKSEHALKEQLYNKRFFLTVGASYPHKNIPLLINAVMRLPENIALVIVGVNNKYYESLKQLAKEQEAKNVIFLNFVSTALLDHLYKNCIGNIYISLYEGFGFPPFEAALNNKVSIISNTTALPEIYDHAAVFVDPLNVDDVIKHLKLVSDENFDASKYLNNFQALKSKYTWQNTASLITSLLLSIKKIKK